MDQELYCQVFLKKEDRRMMSWIPKKYAVINKVLELKNLDGEWEKGWIVVSVFKLEISHKKQRIMSDI